MRMNKQVALMASAGFGLAFLAACSDSPSAPQSRSAFVPKSSFAVGDLTNSTPQVGVLKVCKAGNAGGSFDVTRVAVGASTGTVSGLNTLIATGECRIVALDDGPSGVGSDVTVVEDAAANTVSAVTGCVFIGGEPPVVDGAPCAFNPAARFVNHFHGYVVTYTNTFTPPPPPSGCTFTKGWYRNNGSETVIAVDGRTKAQAQAIFNATPGKPGSVTFGGDATLLNLYQQLLAALNNLGGDANEDNGPAAVDAAIDAAQNGTGGTGTNITTTLTQEEMSALIDTLSAFNEGTFAGWPHCAD